MFSTPIEFFPHDAPAQFFAIYANKSVLCGQKDEAMRLYKRAILLSDGHDKQVYKMRLDAIVHVTRTS